MIGEMRRKGGWKDPCSMGSQNRFANFASVLKFGSVCASLRRAECRLVQIILSSVESHQAHLMCPRGAEIGAPTERKIAMTLNRVQF